MSNSLKNFILLIVVVVLSYFPDVILGNWYHINIARQHGSFFVGLNDAIAFAGFLLAYIFFTTLVFGLFGFRKNKNWIIVLLIVPALLWLSSDPYHIYIPIAFGLAGFILAKLTNLIISKIKHAKRI